MKHLVIAVMVMVMVFLVGCDSKPAPSETDILIYKNIMSNPGSFAVKCKQECGESGRCQAIKDELILKWSTTCMTEKSGESLPKSCSSYQSDVKALCPNSLDIRLSGE